MLDDHAPARYAVMGNPIAHSRSPLIHALFAQQTGQAIHYEALLVGTQTGEFARAVQTFQEEGGQGLNITVPFKQAAWALAEQRSPRATQAGAVNTLRFDAGGRRFGDNTDGIGLVRDLVNNQGLTLTGQRILILGAGGAVRGVLASLLETQPAYCVIANRTLSKAQMLAALVAKNHVVASSYTALAGQTFDLIINGTSASLHGELPPLPDGLLATHGYCYDVVYSKTATPFIHWAYAQGAQRAVDGLGMLVEQAAESFFLWRGVRPSTAPVIAQLALHKEHAHL